MKSPVARSTALLGMFALAGCGGLTMPPDPAPKMDQVAALRAGGASAGPANQAPAESTGAGWGTLKGKFTYAGSPPNMGTLSVNKEQNVCGSSVPNEALVVDSATRGIKNIVIYARRVSRVYDGPDAPKDPPPEFDQKGCRFLTHVHVQQVKDPLIVANSDPTGHNTNYSPPGNPPMNPTLATNDKVPYKFSQQLSEPAPVTCNIHPWMKAYIMARNDPYYAVTADDGSFEIKNLPAGEPVEFQVWHESAPGGALAAKSDWSRGRFTLTIPADTTQELNVEVPPTALGQ